MTQSRIATALGRLENVIANDPSVARVRNPPARAMLTQGLKCRVTGPAGEHVETDMSPALGGDGSSPSPGWLFRAASAACCLTVIAMRAARLGIDLTTLEVLVTSDGDTRGMLGLDEISAGYSAMQTEVRIGAKDATPEQLTELVHWADGHSPVGCTVRDAPVNDLRIVVV